MVEGNRFKAKKSDRLERDFRRDPYFDRLILGKELHKSKQSHERADLQGNKRADNNVL